MTMETELDLQNRNMKNRLARYLKAYREYMNTEIVEYMGSLIGVQ